MRASMRKALFFVLALTASDSAYAGEAEFTMVASDGYQFVDKHKCPQRGPTLLLER
jgi:hypothetical protein